MYHFLPNNTKDLFNNISFILLIFIGAIILFSFNINNENKIIHYALVKYELEINQKALQFFNNQGIDQNSLIAFANSFNNDGTVLINKQGEVVHNSIEQIFIKLRKEKMTETAKNKTLFVNEKLSDENMEKESKKYATDILNKIMNNYKNEKYVDYKNSKIFLAIKLDKDNILFFSKNLPNTYIKDIWQSQLIIILAIITIIITIYATYRVFLIKVVMSDVSKFLNGMRWERENLTGVFSINNNK